jgi:predicted nuclease of predicted toxin-antitoxin system
VARFYSNENIPLQVVEELRKFGHDVLTSRDAGRANAAVPDDKFLAFATQQSRTLLTHNRRDFIALHQRRTGDHSGIVVCTVDIDFRALTMRIDAAVSAIPDLRNQLIRVNRPG